MGTEGPLQRPPFVVVEGPNGVGKTTVAEGLAAALGLTVLRYPADFLRYRQEQGLDVAVAPFARLLFYLAAIAQLSDVVAAAPGPVVCDRYWASPLAFIESDGALPSTVVDRVGAPVLDHIARPDLTLLLRAHPGVLAARIRLRPETRTSTSAQRTLASPEFAKRWMGRLRARSAECGPFVELDTTDRTAGAVVDLAVRCVRTLVLDPGR